MDFKIVNKCYRPVPFWSWNDELNPEETTRQAKLMDEAGLGGYFLHARGGLKTEYMGNDWFKNVDAAVAYSEKSGMATWLYDENGWPSGFGNGKVNGLGEEYVQKYLRMEKGEKHTPRTICNDCGYHFYYEINPFYVDNMDKKVVRKFIDEVYETYFQRYKNRVKGMFTDEPQLSRNGIPWSLILPEEYEKRYGCEIYPHLIELFENTGDYKNTRINFWKLVTDLFSESFMKQIYDWCLAHGWEFTGHMVLEEDLKEQLTTNGAVMPHYEYFTVPGVDWLGRNIAEDGMTPRQLGSVAAQLEKKQVLTECYALCGHSASFDDMRKIVEWNMVRGINLVCPHLEGYSLKGIRKRDYPPAMYYQQPWWNAYSYYNEEMSRIGMILTEGEEKCDVLVIHPQTAAWTMFNNADNEGLAELNDRFSNTVKLLDRKHILYHLGDETILERHGDVYNNTIKVGTQTYDKVILLDDELLLDTTKNLLNKYRSNGGCFVTVEDLVNDIIDSEDITYTKRNFDGFSVHYFVNSTDKEITTHIKAGKKKINSQTGEIEGFDGVHTFRPYDSLLVYDDKTATPSEIKTKKSISTDGEWKVVSNSNNAITLDRCDVYFDGKLIGENMQVLSVQELACSKERAIDVRCVFRQHFEYIPEDIKIAVEYPEKLHITINGKNVGNRPDGYFIDKSFETIPVKDYMNIGENIIELRMQFVQSDVVYDNIKKAALFEGEKNKLYYDMELEPVYITGSFGVYANDFQTLDKNAFRVNGGFEIRKPKETISLCEIEKQGYLFFAGDLTVEKEFDIDDTDYILSLDMKGVNAVKVIVNGEFAGVQIWNKSKMDISKYLCVGKNTITLTIMNNLRNLLGPHHLESGESYTVDPGCFYKEKSIWNGYNENHDWNDGYCFIEMSINN